MKHNIYLKNLKTTVFDIETTGLYSYKDRLISASFCNPENGELTQFYLDNPADEEFVLRQTLGELAKYDAVVTYNGDRFDLPFVLTRAKKHGIADSLPFFWAIDLYKWVKKYWPPAPLMKSLSQKAMEEALGLSVRRTDEIGGAECIELYARWTQIGDESAKDKILLHNGDDVRQLARIGHSLSSLPYHQIAFENGFLVKGKGKSAGEASALMSTNAAVEASALLTGSELKGLSLKTAGRRAAGKMPADIYTDDYRYSYDSLSGEFSLILQLAEGPDIKFIDLAALPVKMDDFAPLAGFHNGFLILEEVGKVKYREANQLIEKMLLAID